MLTIGLKAVKIIVAGKSVNNILKEVLPMEDKNFGNDIITLTDDDGKNYEFEIIDAIETDDGRYLAMIPYFSDPKAKLDDSGELVIVKVFEDEDGEEYFEDIPDDDEYETVADLFINRLQDAFEIDEQ